MVTEMDLAQRLGVSRKFIKDCRILFRDRSFPLRQTVTYEDYEVIAIMEHLGLKKSINEVLRKKTPKVFTVKIKKVCRNPKFIYSQDPDGNEIKVPVKDSTKFTKDMEIPVILSSDGTAKLNRKNPRYKGKW